MPNYTQLQSFQTGQIIGRATMGVLRDNDNYFYGLASRWRPCFHAIASAGGGNNYTFWNGYHLLRDDAMLLYYWFSITAGTSDTEGRILYYDDSGTSREIDSIDVPAGQSDTCYGSYDLSAANASYSAGLHRVKFDMLYSMNEPATGRARPPYTTYTGSQSYTTPPRIRDEDLSAASHFNTWRSNDEYFHACSPINPAFHMIAKGEPGDGNEEVIWDGWIPHNTYAEEVYYKVKFSTDDDDNRLLIYYDYGGSNQYYHVVDTPEVYEESSFALPLNTFSNNTWYRVAVVNTRSGAPGAYCHVDYLYLGPRSTLEVVGTVPDFEVGDWVYGNDSKYPARLSQLSAWDSTIFKAMCWNATVGRVDFAVQDDTARGPYNPVVTHRLVRIYDFLWYRGTGITLEWGEDSSRSLPDTDATNPVLVMDLRSVTQLSYGQHYTLRGNVDFAMEATYSA